MIRIALLASLAAVGCHHEPPPAAPAEPLAAAPAEPTPPAPTSASPTSAAEAVTEGIQMLASVAGVVPAGGNCGQSATALQAWSDAHGELMAKVRADLHKWPQPDVAAAVQDQMPNHPEIKPLIDVANTCARDASFAATFKQIYNAME